MVGLLSRLFGRSAAPSVVRATVFPGDETLEVVGESRYQNVLWELVGGVRREPVRHPVTAVLLPEPGNTYDRNAIQVVVEGRLVGYLSRSDASLYLPGLQALMASCETGYVALEGQIVGGGSRGDRIGFLGVFLDHEPADFGIATGVGGGSSLRTGLTEALATDRADDDYDLSWLTTLAADDADAVTELRALLECERDPIDRHYMFCELEERLYRCRDRWASALDEFDHACVEHHNEMPALTSALVGKFGAVPVIEVYRQASIRWQKAKNWDAARAWAQRGLDVYGDAAARPEVVADLQKRVAHAAVKLEAAARPKTRAPRSIQVATATTRQLETLVCTSCGAIFERERTRGRKPKSCPTCRGVTASVIVE
jgi:hypothetical protein